MGVGVGSRILGLMFIRFRVKLIWFCVFGISKFGFENFWLFRVSGFL